MVDSIWSVHIEPLVFFILLIHFGVQGVAKVDIAAWEVKVLQLDDNVCGHTAGSS